jgi:hypothetical protein
VTCHPGGKNTGIEPHPAHAFPTAERFKRSFIDNQEVTGEREREREVFVTIKK